MPIVYIVQKRQRFDDSLNQYVDAFDLSGVESFGEIKFLLDYKDSGMAQQPLILKLKRGLRDFTNEDSLLLLGKPALIGAATVVAAQQNQFEVPVLFFEHFTKSYYRKIFKF